MHPDSVDFHSIYDDFQRDMMRGLAGEPSTLAMLPTYLSPDGALCDGQTAVVVDIGGTNLRTALVRYTSGGMEIVRSDTSPVPGRMSEITMDEFFRAIADKLRPLIEHSNNVGICFSHAVAVGPDRDGRLISFSKEVQVTGGAGAMIAHGIKEALRALGVQRDLSATLLNDTAAVLLGAEQTSVGFVLGTGMNLSYVEQTTAISKVSGFEPDTMIVNTEAGGFGRARQGTFDRALDAATADPGAHRLEKMTSGRYLGSLVLRTLRGAADAGIFQPDVRQALERLGALSPPETDAFVIGGDGVLAPIFRAEGDVAAAQTVIVRLYERAAKLTAAAVTAAIDKTHQGQSAGQPVRVAAEGSTFHKLHGFADTFSRYVSGGGDGQKRRVELVSAAQATLIGTARAAITHGSCGIG